MFVHNSGRLLEKEELLSNLWPDRIVEESNLTQQIYELRRALGERPKDRRYLVTIPGEGYRFVAPVELVDGDSRPADPLPEASAVPAPSPSRPRWFPWAGGVAVLAGLAAAGVWTQDPLPRPRIGGDGPSLRRVAVLDFPLMSVSSDGRKLAFMDADPRQIWLKNLEDGETRLLVSTRSTLGSWSPDSRQIAFVTHHQGRHQLETLNTATGERQIVRVAESSRDIPNPRQWPGKERLLGTVGLPENRIRLVFVSLPDGELTPIRETVAPTYPVLSLFS